jgi:hypothetical protein
MYKGGRGGLAKDEWEAVRLYRLAADQGNANALFNLGVMYKNGRGGLAKDKREAARLYKLAADQGDADAWFELRIVPVIGLVIVGVLAAIVAVAAVGVATATGIPSIVAFIPLMIIVYLFFLCPVA